MKKQLMTFVALAALSVGVYSSVDAKKSHTSSPITQNADDALTPSAQSLRSLVDYAVAHNPDVNAARQRHLGALARVPQATALPEPKLTYRYFVDEVETRVGPQEHGIGFSQTLLLRSRTQSSLMLQVLGTNFFISARLLRLCVAIVILCFTLNRSQERDMAPVQRRMPM